MKQIPLTRGAVGCESDWRTRWRVHAMISTGEIPEKMVKKIGRRTLIVANELERWVTAQ